MSFFSWGEMGIPEIELHFFEHWQCSWQHRICCDDWNYREFRQVANVAFAVFSIYQQCPPLLRLRHQGTWTLSHVQEIFPIQVRHLWPILLQATSTCRKDYALQWLFVKRYCIKFMCWIYFTCWSIFSKVNKFLCNVNSTTPLNFLK